MQAVHTDTYGSWSGNVSMTRVDDTYKRIEEPSLKAVYKTSPLTKLDLLKLHHLNYMIAFLSRILTM